MRSRRKIVATAAVVALVGGVLVALHARQVTAAVTPATATFSYDSLGRLVTDAYPSNTLNYNYDSAGNRTTSSTQ